MLFALILDGFFMEKEPTMGELKIIIENLSSKVDSGFHGVHKRQDQTNGNVKRNTEHRLRTEGITSVLKWVGAGNVLVFIVYMGSILVK